MEPKQIPQRELRNNVSAVLRDVERGASFRVTVRGRPVADVVPAGRRPTFLTRDEAARIVREAPLDPAFRSDLDEATGATIDEL